MLVSEAGPLQRECGTCGAATLPEVDRDRSSCWDVELLMSMVELLAPLQSHDLSNTLGQMTGQMTE